MRLNDSQTAAVLLRAWWNHGNLIDVLHASLGPSPDLNDLPGSTPAFLPRGFDGYFRWSKGRYQPRDVRPYIATVAPKLSEHLLACAKIEDLVPFIPVVAALRPRASAWAAEHSLSREEFDEAADSNFAYVQWARVSKQFGEEIKKAANMRRRAGASFKRVAVVRT